MERRIFSMRKFIYGLLAAAFAIVSCSKETNDELTTGKTSGGIHVSVGASVPQTKTIVEYNDLTKERRLKFSEGDRLFVSATITGTSNPTLFLAGYLNADEIPAEGSTSAHFSGDLHVFYSDNNETYQGSYSFTTEDPLSECSNFVVTLVHKDAVAGIDYDEEKDDTGTYVYLVGLAPRLAPDINTYMTRNLLVMADSYNAAGKNFPLTSNNGPILNCNISGLTANAEYEVEYHLNYGFDFPIYFPNTVTADDSGKVSFACDAFTREGKHSLVFIPTAGGATKTLDLGTKQLSANKIYNVTKTVS